MKGFEGTSKNASTSLLAPVVFSPPTSSQRGFDKTAAIWQLVSPSNVPDFPSAVHINWQTLESVSLQRCRASAMEVRGEVKLEQKAIRVMNIILFLFFFRWTFTWTSLFKLVHRKCCWCTHTNIQKRPHSLSCCAASWCANDLILRRNTGRGVFAAAAKYVFSGANTPGKTLIYHFLSDLKKKQQTQASGTISSPTSLHSLLKFYHPLCSELSYLIGLHFKSYKMIPGCRVKHITVYSWTYESI